MSEHYFSEEPSSEEKRGLIKTIIRGYTFEFITSTGIFSYRRIDLGTRILIENMFIPSNGSFLDLGCGYGPIGIVAAKVNPELRVYMTDINKRAVELANINADRNNVNVNVLQGNMYEAIDELRFDTIVSNPPVSAGMKKVVEPMIKAAEDHLKIDGSLQMVIRYNKGGRSLESIMKKQFGNVTVSTKKSGYRVFKSTKL